MSETESHIGKLRNTHKTPEQYCKENLHVETPEPYNTFEEYIYERYWEEKEGMPVILDGIIFILEEDKDVTCDSVTLLNETEDKDVYTFYSTYYNGGTTLTECLAKAMKEKLNKIKETSNER